MKIQKLLVLLIIVFIGEISMADAKTNNDTIPTTEKVTAGRDYLGNFAPQFTQINDDILFGQEKINFQNMIEA